MALPSGYVQIDYIESTGTQYINTSFTPKGSSRIVMDCELTDVSKTSCFFCARNRASSTDSMSNTSFLINGQYRRDYYGTSKSTTASYAANQRFIVDANKETVTYGSDYTLSFTSTSTSSPMPCILMASAALGTTSGSVSSLANYASMKLYSCQIYDNGILVRDFVPCKTDSGELGLYDNIDSRFYANAGTGTFIAGADVIQDNNKHKTLIDSTGYEIKSGRVLIAGTGYDIKKGRTRIDGTGYDITFATPISALPVGTSVYADYNGVRTEFIVIQQGNPDPAIYDVSCNGTWLLIKDIFEKYVWYNNAVSTSYYYYDKSVLKRKLDTEVLNKFSANMQNMIKQVKIPAMITGWNDIKYGSEGLDAKLFPLSVTEIVGTDAETFDNDGAQLSYFAENTDLTARIAYYNGTAIWWWLRSNRITLQSGSNSIYVIMQDGRAASTNSFSDKNGNRFAFIMPSETLIDDDFNIIEE